MAGRSARLGVVLLLGIVPVLAAPATQAMPAGSSPAVPGQGGRIADLGTLGGEAGTAAGLSAARWVAGRAGIGDNRAVLWDGDQATELGTLGGPSSRAYDINAAGQVVGYAETATGDRHAVLWADGQMTDLGTLGGCCSEAYAINEAGQVVGRAQTAAGELLAFLWEGGRMTDLGTLAEAWDINAAGQVVGESYARGGSHAFLWEGGRMTDLGTLGGGYSRANAINDAGQVVGGSRTDADEEFHAVLWDGGQITDLGTLGGDYSEAKDINDAGQVVGLASSEEGSELGWRAFLWADGTMTEFDALGESSSAEAINEAGQVAGWAAPAPGGGRAVRWDGGQITDLGGAEAFGINDAGQVVGWAEAEAVGPAQAATPAATPGAAACTVAPRPADEVIALWFGNPAGTPVVRAAPTPVPVAAEAALPQGEPADAATVAAVTAAARELEACTDAGDLARGLALITDDLIRRTALFPGMTAEQVRAILAAPARPLPAEQRVPPATIRDVRVLADGRVGVVATGPPPAGVTAFIVFARVGDRWLVDEFIEVEGVGSPTTGTPVP